MDIFTKFQPSRLKGGGHAEKAAVIAEPYSQLELWLPPKIADGSAALIITGPAQCFAHYRYLGSNFTIIGSWLS